MAGTTSTPIVTLIIHQPEKAKAIAKWLRVKAGEITKTKSNYAKNALLTLELPTNKGE